MSNLYYLTEGYFRCSSNLLMQPPYKSSRFLWHARLICVGRQWHFLLIFFRENSQWTAISTNWYNVHWYIHPPINICTKRITAYSHNHLYPCVSISSYINLTFIFIIFFIYSHILLFEIILKMIVIVHKNFTKLVWKYITLIFS